MEAETEAQFQFDHFSVHSFVLMETFCCPNSFFWQLCTSRIPRKWRPTDGPCVEALTWRYKVRPVWWSRKVKGNPKSVFEGPITSRVIKSTCSDHSFKQHDLFQVNKQYIAGTDQGVALYIISTQFILQHIAVCEITSRGCYRVFVSQSNKHFLQNAKIHKVQ